MQLRGRVRGATNSEIASEANQEIVVVSGLPRSGTSMMMQMLAAGGLPALSDGARTPDAANPRGYYEWEPARALFREPAAIAAARGRAVKVISALLPALAPEHRYRVLLMERDLDEVAASQRAMLAADDGVGPAEFARHLARTRAWLAAQPQVATLAVAYRDALAEPRATAERVRAFLGLPLDAAAMAAAVDPALYRVRSRRSS